MEKKINRFQYELVYALNKLTSSWLKKANDRIKTEGLSIISSNEDNNITIQHRSAQAKYSKEVEEQIQKIKAENEPINKSEKVKVILVEHIGIGTNKKVSMIFDKLEDYQENQAIAKVASALKNTSK